MRGECPEPRPDCPYAGDCFSDLHHEYYPGIDYHGIMESEFRELPENKQQICRWEHEQRHHEPPPVKPEREFMLGRIVLALDLGEISLSKRKLKKLGLQHR